LNSRRKTPKRKNKSKTEISETLDSVQKKELECQKLEAIGDLAASKGRIIDALRSYDSIVALGGASATVWSKIGEYLLLVGEQSQAIGAFQHSIALDATNAATHHNLARALFSLGEVDQSLESLRKATTLTSQLDPWQGIANLIPGAPKATNADVLEARSHWAKRLAKDLGITLDAKGNHRIARRESERPIHVAYLSAHFGGQNYMKPVWGLINRHDRSAFRVDLLSDKKSDSSISGYKPFPTDTITDVSCLNDAQLSEFITSREIDILVDLSAYSHQRRLSFFLQKVAPITIAWFNMFATSGFPGFDLIVGDKHVVPPEEEQFYTEQVIRLPCSYLTFQVNYEVPDVSPLPCLASDRFTFGSLVSQYKITPPVIDAWSEILRRCPESRLLLANSELKSPSNRSYLAEKFVSQGIDSDRLLLLPPAPHHAYLKYYDQIDLALDAYPYNGGTTTMESIWQGVPVLTKCGDRWAARTSQSLLLESHLSDFVARDQSSFIEQSVRWATDKSAWPELAKLRNTMREKLLASRVCDCDLLTREMETLFRGCLANELGQN
jgi:protein O-GlcNAc transferase